MSNNDYECLKLCNQLCFPLYAAARSVTSMYTPYLTPLGLTYTRYLVFLVLWENDGITVGEICRRLMLDSGTVSPMLKKMREQGYIQKHQSSDDERTFIITLTEKGWALQQEAKDIPQKIGICIKLKPEKAKQLYDLLYELLDNDNDNNNYNTKGE